MSITDNYAKIKQETRDKVRIMAVSKTFGKEAVVPLLNAGVRLFGENKVGEALEKWTDLKQEYPHTELHLIGHLQRNKIKEALSIFDSIDSLDNDRLAMKIAEHRPDNTKFMIEVNTGSEPQKSGVLPNEADDFIRYCINDLRLNVTGLMCIPPFDEEPSPHFAFLKGLARRHNLPDVNMGMSGDYMLAIQQGATVIRIGTLLFGKRQKSDD